MYNLRTDALTRRDFNICPMLCTASDLICQRVTLICLLIESATRACPNGYVRCEGDSPRRRCIRQTWLCDGDNDCGNNWDEQSASCGQL